MADTALKPVNDGAETAARSVTATPRADVLETEDEFLVLADMPGVKPEDVDIRFENGELTVLGRRTPCHAGKEPAVRVCATTTFYRAFRLTDHVAADRIAAELKDGVLTLHLPKVEAVKPRRIAVKG